MNSSWKRDKVSVICNLIVDCVNRTAPIFEHETPYRMIRTTNVRNGKIDLSNARFVNLDTFTRWTRRAEVLDGDVILTREAPIGEVGIINNHGQVFLGQRLMQYRANKRIVDPHFLYYSFLTPDLQHQFQTHDGSGSVVSHIRVADCHDFMVSYPPLPEQRAIASVLCALDDKIALNRRMNETLEGLARALFKDWFVDFGPTRAKASGAKPYVAPETLSLFPDRLDDNGVPEGWEEKQIKDFCLRVESGGTPSRKVAEYWENGTVPWLTSGEVRKPIITETENFISNRGLEESSAKLWPPLSTVVAMYGATAGQVTLLACQTSANQACCALVPKPHTRSFVFMKAKLSIQLYESRARGSAQQNLNKSLVSNLETIAPPEQILQRFDEIVLPLIEKMIKNELESRTLAQTRDLLLPKLMSGALRVGAAEKIVEGVL